MASSAPSVTSIPGRTTGFTCGIISLIIWPLLIASLPLAIIGCVKSAKALKWLPSGTGGRGVAVVGLVASILTLSIAAIVGPALLASALANASG